MFFSVDHFCPSPPPISLFSGISATDGRQSAFHAGYYRMPIRRHISSLVGLHLPFKQRLQLFIFSRIPYLYKAPEKRARKPWQNGRSPIHRRPQNVLSATRVSRPMIRSMTLKWTSCVLPAASGYFRSRARVHHALGRFSQDFSETSPQVTCWSSSGWIALPGL